MATSENSTRSGGPNFVLVAVIGIIATLAAVYFAVWMPFQGQKSEATSTVRRPIEAAPPQNIPNGPSNDVGAMGKSSATGN